MQLVKAVGFASDQEIVVILADFLFVDLLSTF